MHGVRWEGDERGEGLADAAAFVPGVAELVDAMRHPAWVTEQPDVHLLPHLERASRSLPLDLMDANQSADGTYEVRLRWTGEKGRVADVKAAVFALVGGFSEPSSYIRQRTTDDGSGDALFEIVTGFVDGDSSFTPHGHTVRLDISGI